MAACCSVDKCNSQILAKGMCSRHYNQMRKNGYILEKDNIKNKGNTCLAENCDKPAYTKGYCRKHIQQINNLGEVQSNTTKDFNEIVDKGHCYELILTDVKGKEVARCKIDKEDLSLVQSIGRWHLNDKGYVFNNNNKRTSMHRLIMNAPEGFDVDHKKNGFEFRRDNRKKNLRLATESQNNYNVAKRKDNSSGYKGVSTKSSKINSDKPWQAQIMINKKPIHLGWFKTAKEASKAYEKAAKKAHKEFYRKT
jgi:hypothetical protein